MLYPFPRRLGRRAYLRLLARLDWATGLDLDSHLQYYSMTRPARAPYVAALVSFFLVRPFRDWLGRTYCARYGHAWRTVCEETGTPEDGPALTVYRWCARCERT